MIGGLIRLILLLLLIILAVPLISWIICGTPLGGCL